MCVRTSGCVSHVTNASRPGDKKRLLTFINSLPGVGTSSARGSNSRASSKAVS
jgi:hypothetical protein